MSKMKIEVWSDIMCPFCYIGKRRLEHALRNSPLKDKVELDWKSYQLNPDLVTDSTIRIYDYLALHKGIPVEQAIEMNKQVAAMAKEEGLDFDFDKSVIANSMKAHQLIHFAKKFDKQNEAKEILFKSYFTEGKNIDDIEVLKLIVRQLGLDTVEFESMLASGVLEDEVKMDIHEARQIGVKGVPFFVFNRKYAISGAQPLELFVQTLEQAFEEWKPVQPIIVQNTNEADSCGIDGCD